MLMDFILILVLLTHLRLLASSRLGACIRITALQGILLSLLPLLTTEHAWSVRVLGLALGSALLKGVLFPKLLFRTLREAEVSREVEPYVGYGTSLMFGVLAVAASFWIARHLPLPAPLASQFLAPVAMSGMWCGLFLIIARKRAVNQVLGFIVLENGIFTFGAGVMGELSLLIEMGVLLDVFVAVFLMGIMVFHISREFDHMDTDRLSNLKD